MKIFVDINSEWTHLRAHLMQGGCDGLGWSIAAKHMALKHAGVFIAGHKGKVPTEHQKT